MEAQFPPYDVVPRQHVLLVRGAIPSPIPTGNVAEFRDAIQPLAASHFGISKVEVTTAVSQMQPAVADTLGTEVGASTEELDDLFMTALVEDFRRARVMQGLSQLEVAKRMRTTQSAVSEFEGGKCRPTLSTLCRYARAIGHIMLVGIMAGEDHT